MKKIIIISASLIILILGIYTLKLLDNNGVFNKSNKEETKEISNSSNSSTISTTIYVCEIKGEVNCPGVYYFTSEETIVKDIVDMAMGLTSLADTSDINMSELVENHSVILIGSYATNTQSFYSNSENKSDKININRASEEELQILNGIGPQLASKIVSYRLTYGSFSSIEDIKKVSGIGDSLYEKIKNYITV